MLARLAVRRTTLPEETMSNSLLGMHLRALDMAICLQHNLQVLLKLVVAFRVVVSEVVASARRVPNPAVAPIRH